MHDHTKILDWVRKDGTHTCAHKNILHGISEELVPGRCRLYQGTSGHHTNIKRFLHQLPTVKIMWQAQNTNISSPKDLYKSLTSYLFLFLKSLQHILSTEAKMVIFLKTEFLKSTQILLGIHSHVTRKDSQRTHCDVQRIWVLSLCLLSSNNFYCILLNTLKIDYFFHHVCKIFVVSIPNSEVASTTKVPCIFWDPGGGSVHGLAAQASGYCLVCYFTVRPAHKDSDLKQMRKHLTFMISKL